MNHRAGFTVLDDRGKVVKVRGTQLLDLPRGILNRPIRGAAEVVQRMVRTRDGLTARPPIALGRKGTWFATILSGALIIGLVYTHLNLPQIGWKDTWILSVFLVISAGGATCGWLENLGIIARNFDHLSTTQEILQQIAVEGSCFSCGYSVGGLATESDGCTVCPECGSAWRLRQAP